MRHVRARAPYKWVQTIPALGARNETERGTCVRTFVRIKCSSKTISQADIHKSGGAIFRNARVRAIVRAHPENEKKTQPEKAHSVSIFSHPPRDTVGVWYLGVCVCVCAFDTKQIAPILTKCPQTLTHTHEAISFQLGTIFFGKNAAGVGKYTPQNAHTTI